MVVGRSLKTILQFPYVGCVMFQMLCLLKWKGLLFVGLVRLSRRCEGAYTLFRVYGRDTKSWAMGWSGREDV